MKYSDLIKAEIEHTYAATEGLMKLVDNDKLNWKPATGKNWMTTGQLLKHLPMACGLCIKGFVTGDWGMPEGEHGTELPSAEKMASVKSVDEAISQLRADKKLALETLAKVKEEDLEKKMISAPWGGPPMPLGVHCHQMVGHLGNHKSQLFYYLKLMGKDVNTMHLYGMGGQ